MDSDQDLLDCYEARELADWKRNKEAQQRYESAARQAHKIRMAGGLLLTPMPAWEEIDLSSRRHLIADAEHVANNPSITLEELTKMYQERLMSWGDTGNPDLEPSSAPCRNIEQMVVDRLKAVLKDSAVAPLAAPYRSETEA